MKRIIYTLFIGAAGILLGTSCKRESLLTYATSDNIYFDYLEGVDPSHASYGWRVDSMGVTFAFSPESVKDTLITIPVSVTGAPHDRDRSFAVSVDPTSGARLSEHFVFPASFTIRSGRLTDSLSVKFIRTPDLRSAPVLLKLRLEENDQFQTKIKYRSKNPLESIYMDRDTVWATTFRFSITDMLSEGPYWGSYHYYLGAFSEKKVRLMNQIAGMPLDFWSEPISNDQKMFDVTYYGAFMARYLADQEYAGNTIFESDGVTPMRMGDRFR